MVQKEVVAGYLHILVQSLEVEGCKGPIHGHITLGEIAKMDTTPRPSGEVINQVFLSQVSNNTPRFILRCLDSQKELGECRYDIHPFMQRDGITHTLDSDLFGQNNCKIGKTRIKLTFHSSKHGILKVRIFGLEFHSEFIKQFREAKVRVLSGIYAQSTPVRPLSQVFDETVQIILLKPQTNLTFEIINDKGTLASYSIKNVQQAGLLTKDPKAFQVNVLNNGNPIGLIKYRTDWITH